MVDVLRATSARGKDLFGGRFEEASEGVAVPLPSIASNQHEPRPISHAEMQKRTHFC
jgi:hypothetical protein